MIVDETESGGHRHCIPSSTDQMGPAYPENVGVAIIGSSSTRLVVFRGDSGSGKTTAALALRPRLGERTALLQQDYFRRELLRGADKEKRAADTAELVDKVARHALNLGYDVILDGIFNLRDWADRLELLWRDHAGTTRFYQFDVGLEETLRRHETRELRTEFGPDKMRDWYAGWQPLPFTDERRVTAGVTADQLVNTIIADLDHPVGSANRN